jgi:Cu/Ag efflux protein CusF
MDQMIRLSRRRVFLTLPLLAVSALFFADEVFATEPPAMTTQQAKIFHGVGTITGLDAESGVVSIRHEDIPGLMSAMEMPFEAKPSKILDGLKIGDKVDFTVDGKSLTILEIRKRN